MVAVVVDAGCYRSNFNFQVRMRRGRNERTNPEGRRWEGEQSIGAGERERDALHAWNGGGFIEQTNGNREIKGEDEAWVRRGDRARGYV